MGADAPNGGRMSVRIQYAYLKQQTWLYRRNYPKELQGVLGQAYKQSLKTGDARVAKARAAEVNAKYEEIIAKAKAGGVVEKPKPVVVEVGVWVHLDDGSVVDHLHHLLGDRLPTIESLCRVEEGSLQVITGHRLGRAIDVVEMSVVADIARCEKAD
jgi:hypothetical protein